MDLVIQQRKVPLSRERVLYNQIRGDFACLADEADRRFAELYQANSSLEDVVQKAPEQFRQSLQPVLDRCVAILMKHNVLTVDTQMLLETYGTTMDAWSESYLRVRDQYAEVVLNEEQLDAYRRERRENRGRVVGGGFGFSGAVKGMATAGAMNMALGAGHMLVNGLGKITSSIAASSKKSRIFRDPETLETLRQGVWQTAFRCHFALISALNQFAHEPMAANGAVTPEAARGAAAMVNNARQITDLARCLDAMLQALELNPYQAEWYAYFLERFGDPDGELERLADYFGVQTVRRIKAEQLRAFAESLSLETEEQALDAQSRVRSYCRSIGLTGSTEETERIDAVVARFDQAYRTVDGMELPTRRSADEARAELQSILTAMQRADFNSLASIQSTQAEIAHFHTPVAEKYQSDLDHRAHDLMDYTRIII